MGEQPDTTRVVNPSPERESRVLKVVRTVDAGGNIRNQARHVCKEEEEDVNNKANVDKSQVVRFCQTGGKGDQGVEEKVHIFKGGGVEFLCQLRVQAKRMKRKLQNEETRRRHQEIRGGIPVRGTTVLGQNPKLESVIDQNPLSCPNILKSESENYRQESAIEMFKAFSAVVDKKPQAPTRESYLFDERLVSMQNDAIAAVEAATETVTDMAIKGTGVNEAIAVVLKAAKAVAALAETEEAEDEALLVREKLHKLHKLQEAAKMAEKAKVGKVRQDKVLELRQAEVAKMMDLEEAENERVKNLRQQANEKLKDLKEDMMAVNRNKSDREKKELKLKEAEKLKVEDTGTLVNVKEVEQAEPMKLKAVVEAVENCVLQQKQNLLNIKNKKGTKSEKNKTEVDFDCLFKGSCSSDAGKTSNKTSSIVMLENDPEVAEKKKEEVKIIKEIKTEEKTDAKEEMERRVSDIRDCWNSSDVVIMLEPRHPSKVEVPFSPNSFFSKLSKEARKICTSLQEEGGVGKEMLTDKSENRRNYKPLEHHYCLDESRVQRKNSRGKEEKMILGESKESEAEKTTHPVSEERIAPITMDVAVSTDQGRHYNSLEEQQQHSYVDGGSVPNRNSRGKEEQVILRESKAPEAEQTTPPLSENQPESLELVAKDLTIGSTAACERDDQRREDARSSLGGILLVVLVLWLVLESSVEPSETK